MISLDGSSSPGTYVTANTLFWNYTNAGSLLIVWVHANSGTVFTVTFNGVAMAEFERSTPGFTLVGFYLVNPLIGTGTISVTQNSTNTMTALAASYKNAAGIDSHNQATGSGTTINVSTTVVANNCWLVGAGGGLRGANIVSIASNKTDRQSILFGVGNVNGLVEFDSNANVATGSQTATVTFGASSLQAGAILASIFPGDPSNKNALFFAGN